MARWLGVILAAVVALQLCEGRPAGLFDRLILAGRRRGTSMVPPPPPEAYASNDNVKTAYFDQPLDHFDGSVKDTWKQVSIEIECFARLHLTCEKHGFPVEGLSFQNLGWLMHS